jgi:tight adherence protein B
VPGVSGVLSALGRVCPRHGRAGDDPAAVGETVLRLAVLLQAGIAPARAWQHLGESGDAAAQRVSAACRRGEALVDAIGRAGVAADPAGGAAAEERTGAWRDVGAAWRVASIVGAPLADSLRGIAAALRDAQEAKDEVAVALAEPAGTARLMSWLPLVAVGLGLALGFDTLGVLVGSPVGWACLAAGIALVIAASRWSARLVRRARDGSGIPGLGTDVLAIALSSGASIDRARALVADALGHPLDDAAESILSLSRRAGVPAVELLRASASLERHRARTAARLRAAHLSSRLLLPLGVCTLPAFLLLGVAPMMLSVMSAVPLTL